MTIPNSCIMISWSWHHYCRHDRRDVESWPLEHKFIQERLLFEVLVSPLSHFFLNWNSSRIMKWIWVISVIVRLNNEPIIITELIECMNSSCISLHNTSFIWSNTWDNIVNRTTNSLSFNSSQSWSIISLLLKRLSQQPASGHTTINQHTDKIISKMFSFSSINIDSKSTMSDPG